MLATDTGVLLGATAVPVWSSHHRLPPFHLGVVALGSASAILELLDIQMAALQANGCAGRLCARGRAHGPGLGEA